MCSNLFLLKKNLKKNIRFFLFQEKVSQTSFVATFLLREREILLKISLNLFFIHFCSEKIPFPSFLQMSFFPVFVSFCFFFFALQLLIIYFFPKKKEQNKMRDGLMQRISRGPDQGQLNVCRLH